MKAFIVLIDRNNVEERLAHVSILPLWVVYGLATFSLLGMRAFFIAANM